MAQPQQKFERCTSTTPLGHLQARTYMTTMIRYISSSRTSFANIKLEPTPDYGNGWFPIQ
jgi:hypothetical protein